MITLEKNTRVQHNGIPFKIRRILTDLKTVICESLITGEVKQILISELMPFQGNDESSEARPLVPIELLTDEQIKKGEARLAIIKPFLNGTCDPIKLSKSAKKNKIGVSTIYRWRSAYLKTSSIVSLVDLEGRGGKGKSRLNAEVERIINDIIDTVYLKKKSVTKTLREIEILCRKEGLPTPNVKSVKNRIAQRSEYLLAKHRRGPRKADEIYSPKTGTIPGADHPLSLVQIDHTKLDIIIVDDDYRKPLGRPWLTLLIDVFSRMPVGLYISLDPPGDFGTGYAIYVSIYPKDKLLAKLEIDAEWPIWGAMKVLHCDNAGEFHSKMLENACLQYGITIKFRPVKRPHYGGHIERLLGTFNKEIHELPGTTFSNPVQRKYFDYDSEKFAAFTLMEIEQWLVTYVTKVYSIRKHTGIGMPPIEKFKEGIFGTKDSLAVGQVPVLHENEAKLRLDFMPFFERTIQTYGVEIDNLKYYGDILKPYVNLKEEHEFKLKRKKQKFQFKRDPRDISRVYFLDPQTKEYFQIPYANMSGPAMSIWEKREIERDLKKHGKEINETEIFRGYQKLKEIEENSIKKTKKERRNVHRKAQAKANPSPDVPSGRQTAQRQNESEIDFIPFEGIEHEAFE